MKNTIELSNKDRPIIYMSNHSSRADIPIIASILSHEVRMFAFKSVFNYPLICWSWALKTVNNVALDDKNKHTLKQSYETLSALLTKDQPYWISPEGYNTTSEPLAPFKNGAFKLARQKSAVIVPFAIHGANEILNIQSLKNIQINTGRDVYIKFGEPIDSDNFGTRIELRNHTYDVIENLITELDNDSDKN